MCENVTSMTTGGRPHELGKQSDSDESAVDVTACLAALQIAEEEEEEEEEEAAEAYRFGGRAGLFSSAPASYPPCLQP